MIRAALVLALVAVPMSARAQRVGAWTVHERVLTNGVQDVACSRDRAFARDWFGSVAMFDGERWTPLPERDRSHGAYGRSIVASPDGHVFIEASGAIAEWTGSEWRTHALDRWRGDVDAQIAAPSAREVYYVGEGRIARFDGRAFTTYGAGTWRSLAAVALIGGDVWVGGQGGTILRHAGSSWTRMDTGTDAAIRRIVEVAPNDTWAFTDTTSSGSIALHLESGCWARRSDGLEGRITGLGGAAGAVYATTERRIARWNGHAWQVELEATSLSGHHSFEGVCATDRHVVVGDGSGGALVRAR